MLWLLRDDKRQTFKLDTSLKVWDVCHERIQLINFAFDTFYVIVSHSEYLGPFTIRCPLPWPLANITAARHGYIIFTYRYVYRNKIFALL